MAFVKIKELYSQDEEERYIVDYFNGVTANFIDIGAYHPYRLSNVRKLYELGWKGSFVEPVKRNFDTFVEEYGDDEDIKLFNIGLLKDGGSKEMFMTDDGALCTFSDQHKGLWERQAGIKYVSELIYCMSTKDFFNNNNFPNLKFINIDVEGMNKEILEDIPHRYIKQADMICIEYEDKQDFIKSYLTGFDYKMVHENSNNIIMAK